jgi:hypothetical protein
VKVACTAPFASPSITEIPDVRVTVLAPVAEFIALTVIPLKVITSKAAVVIPVKLTVIVVAFVSEEEIEAEGLLEELKWTSGHGTAEELQHSLSEQSNYLNTQIIDYLLQWERTRTIGRDCSWFTI